jgi:peptide/nickel transport system substrate-binding protein
LQVNGNDPTNAVEQIALTPFSHYVGGKPKLDEFMFHVYADQTQLEQAFDSNQLNGVEGLSSVPNSIAHKRGVVEHNLLLSAGTYVFFKTTSGVLSDQNVRLALVQAANVPSIIAKLGYLTIPVTEPLLKGQLAYNPAYQQAAFNLAAANTMLTADGWVMGKDGIRSKAGQQLSFTLSAANNAEYQAVSERLSAMWRKVGAVVSVQLQPPDSFTTVVSEHQYQAVLYGISIGVDPDVFVYWDSSQADIRSTNRLNLSEFKNPVADEALESGRTRLEPALRVIKYQPFLQVWQQQAPALGLYQPRVLYITNSLVAGFTNHTLNASTDRFNDVQNWEVREARVTNP